MCFEPRKMSHSFIENCNVRYLCKFHIVKDERLVSEIEVKTNFSRRLQADRNWDC